MTGPSPKSTSPTARVWLPSRQLCAALALLYAVTLFYASTVISPVGFRFIPDDPMHAVGRLYHVIFNGFAVTGSDQRADWTANLMTMIPLAMLVTAAMRIPSGFLLRALSAAVALVLCMVWVLALKYTQLFFVRTVTLNYITAQWIGSLLGVLIATLGEGVFARLFGALLRRDRQALQAVMLVASFAVVAFMLEPFDFALSPSDLAERVAMLSDSLFALPFSDRPGWMRPLLWVSGGGLLMPIGMAIWLSLAKPGRKPSLWAVLPRGALVVGAVWGMSLLVMTANTSVFSLPSRLGGVLLGAWLLSAMSPARLAWVRMALARTAPWLVLPYVVGLLAANGLLSHGWRDWDAAWAAIDPRFWLPLWTHYIVSKAQAARSVAVHLALFAPIGALLWAPANSTWRNLAGEVRIGSGRQFAALALGFALSLAIEVGRWFKPGLLPDFNDAVIGAFAAWATLRVLPAIWAMLTATAAEFAGARER